MHKPVMLIVEDDIFIALEAAMRAEEAGYAVIAARSVKSAQRVMETETIDAAIVDFNLPDGFITPVVEALKARGLPYSLVSGENIAKIEAAGIANPPLVAKPADYLRVIANLMADADAPVRRSRFGR